MYFQNFINEASVVIVLGLCLLENLNHAQGSPKSREFLPVRIKADQTGKKPPTIENPRKPVAAEDPKKSTRFSDSKPAEFVNGKGSEELEVGSVPVAKVAAGLVRHHSNMEYVLESSTPGNADEGVDKHQNPLSHEMNKNYNEADDYNDVPDTVRVKPVNAEPKKYSNSKFSEGGKSDEEIPLKRMTSVEPRLIILSNAGEERGEWNGQPREKEKTEPHQ